MHEHPVLGAVLFVIGTAMVCLSFAATNMGASGSAGPLIVGHLLVLNGVLLAVLGTADHSPVRIRKSR